MTPGFLTSCLNGWWFHLPRSRMRNIWRSSFWHVMFMVPMQYTLDMFDRHRGMNICVSSPLPPTHPPKKKPTSTWRERRLKDFRAEVLLESSVVVGDKTTSKEQRLSKEEAKHIILWNISPWGKSGIKGVCGGKITEGEDEGNQIRKRGYFRSKSIGHFKTVVSG